MTWKRFQCYWPFLRAWWRHQMETFSALLALCAGISPHKGHWRGALIFSLICVWINDWVNNREAGDLRRYRAHYDVTLMGNLTVTGGCLSQRASSNAEFGVRFDVCLDKLLHRQWRCPWFETVWRPCDITVMVKELFGPELSSRKSLIVFCFLFFMLG